jgi:hypothetical protein
MVRRNVEAVIASIDEVLGGENLRSAIQEATGFDNVVVVTGNPYDTDEQQAMLAAATARDRFLPQFIGSIADSALQATEIPREEK